VNLGETVVDLKTRVLEQDHPSTIAGMANLADVCIQRSRAAARSRKAASPSSKKFCGGSRNRASYINNGHVAFNITN
jgi:hypothetical protein